MDNIRFQRTATKADGRVQLLATPRPSSAIDLALNRMAQADGVAALPRGSRCYARRYGAPWANAYAERWVGTVRRELLDRMLILGCGQLRSVLADYVDQYSGHRPHRALGQTPPLWPDEPAVAVPAGRVVRRDRLGGLIHEYAQAA